MNDDLFISGAEANELHNTIARREGVIRILENDLRLLVKKRNRLYSILNDICKGEHSDRCGILENCTNCSIRNALEQCK